MFFFFFFFFKCWHPCGVHLKFIVHNSYFHVISDEWALHNKSCNYFNILDGPPQSWDDEPAIFSILLGETEHMSCHFGSWVWVLVMSHPPSSWVSKDYSSNFHDMVVPPEK